MQVLLNQINDILFIRKNGSKTGTGLLIIKFETNNVKIKTLSNKRSINYKGLKCFTHKLLLYYMVFMTI